SYEDRGAGALKAKVIKLAGHGDGTFDTSGVTIWSNQPTGCIADGMACTMGPSNGCCSGSCGPGPGGGGMCAPAGGRLFPPLNQLNLADLNGDGKLDIVAGQSVMGGGQNTSVVLAAVLLNPGSSTWPAATLLKVTSATQQFVVTTGLNVGN